MKKKCICALIALALFGCAKTNDELPEEIRSAITQSVHSILGKDAYVRSQPLLAASALFDRINGLSNAVMRVKCVERFVDELCAMDTSELTYVQKRDLSNDLDTIEIREIYSTLMSSTQDWTIVYRQRMRVTDYLKEMFESVRPKQRRGKAEDVASIRPRSEWIMCYQSLYLTLKYRMERLERMQDMELEQVSQEERQRVCVVVEKWLGRKLRTREEIHKEHDEYSEEYQAVVRREFDPPKCEKCSEHPSSGAIIR